MTADFGPDAMLNDLVPVLLDALADDLVGVYLYGSLATDDFVEGRSDVDLLMVLRRRVDPPLLGRLIALHRRFGADRASWPWRLDVAYVGRDALWTCQSAPYETIVSDDRELLRTVDAPAYYLIDWFKVQEHGRVLFGPDVAAIMPTISVDRFRQTVYDYLQDLAPFTAEAKKRGEQAYAVLTVCRSLYAYAHGRHASKRSGADWAMGQYPQWRGLIENSLDWNRDETTDDVLDDDSHHETVRFVDFMLSEAARLHG